MKVQTMAVGPIGTNCYLVFDEASMEGMVVDPGFDAPRILEAVKKAGFTVKYLLATHGHFDHVTALREMQLALPEAKVLCHSLEATTLREGKHALRLGVPGFDPVEPDVLLEDGDSLHLGDAVFTVIHTPGHTAGSICLAGEGILLTGDTLFYRECGRCDLPTGDFGQMLASLKRLAELPGDYKVYPGHMESSTLEEERAHNRYMREGMGLS